MAADDDDSLHDASRNSSNGTDDSTMTGREESWLNTAAIRWNPDVTTCKSPSPYWDENKFGNLLQQQQGDDGCFISYESLLIITSHVVTLLRRELHDCISKMGEQLDGELVGLPIAVAIPEGPLLPLAILALHVLNEPFLCNDNNLYYAILVPMDPSDAKERLQQMMATTRPVLCLTCSQQDANGISQQVDAAGIAYSKNQTIMCRPSLETKTRIIDFSEMIRCAVQQCKNIDPAITARIRNHMTTSLCTESIAQLILESIQLLNGKDPEKSISLTASKRNRISHVVYTSGTTGVPKGCVSSIFALRHYLGAKNEAHAITSKSIVLLASSLSFDPCLSDILATFQARATLAIAPKRALVENLYNALKTLDVTHVLCTTTLWSTIQQQQQPQDLPLLQVVALGGEPISKRIVKKWARTNGSLKKGPRLLATYGVTEACVYQTCGEVFYAKERYDEKRHVGQDVGLPLRGCIVQICEQSDVSKESEGEEPHIGEIVLSGSQLDEFSSYLNQPELSQQKFVRVQGNLQGNPKYSYRTGDRGYIDKETNRFHILGRIYGEDGMVKINGVRVELGEIEAALVDDSDDETDESSHSVVNNCLATVYSQQQQQDNDGGDGSKQIHAYIVLSRACLDEMNIVEFPENGGILCTSGPLLTLLRARCIARVRPGCLPSTYVIIPRLPQSTTGKCDRRKLPPLSHCVAMDSLGTRSIPLAEYGKAGALVAQHLVECLNLQPCQHAILRSTSSFGMIGGDSLAATMVVRSLYAYHYNVANTRRLGGSYGVLDGPFAAVHLLRAETMGDYIDWLDRHGVCKKRNEDSVNGEPEEDLNGHGGNDQMPRDVFISNGEQECQQDMMLYKAMLEAATLGYSLVAMALLNLGVDPNLGGHGGRLSRVSHRNQRRKNFTSSPLHLACSRGDAGLTRKLLEKGSKFNSPDASGTFPIHLACARTATQYDSSQLENSNHECTDEEVNRIECVKLLLDAGVPLSMKDANKQTVLHSAARSGHCMLLDFLMQCWIEAGNAGTIHVYTQSHKGGLFDWPDRWSRTPVHWAVLNGQVGALRILLKNGCSANPPKPKASSRQTSLEIESPFEICARLFGETEGIGKEISQLLQNGTVK